MKICIIANGYPDKREPQWGCFERDQALALAQLGHQVSILYVDRRFRTYWRKIGFTKKNEDGITVYGLFVMSFRWLEMLNYKVHDKVASWLLYRVFRIYAEAEGMPDLIYAHFIWNIAYASILKEKYGIPIVGIEHWSGLNNEVLAPRARYWGNKAYANTDKLISVANSLRERILFHFNKDSVVVHNMIGEEFLNIQKNGTNDGVVKFVSTGSLIRRKGFDVLIQAFEQAANNLPEWNLTIIGDGHERENLQTMIDKSGLSNRIKLVGRKNKNEIIQVLSTSSVFVLSSRAENFSVAVLEALAVGLPVVATLCGGIKECINETNGILVPVEDVERLSQALIDMSLGLKCFDNVIISKDCMQKFAPQVIVNKLTDIFEEVIRK